MQLSEQHVEAFIELYKKHYGVVLDREVAVEKGIQLCRLVELVDFSQSEYEEE